MSGVSHIKILESVETLKKLLEQQKTVDRFQKIQVLYLLKGGKIKTITEVAQVVGRHRVTVQYWLKCYQQEGIEGLLKNKKRGGRNSLVPPCVVAKLNQELANNPSLGSYKDVQMWLKQKFQLQVSYDVVYYLVRKKLNIILSSGRKHFFVLHFYPLLSFFLFQSISYYLNT
ncbi:MAG: helix-turn-helix domain-containing protein [Geminocystis sp.]|nr:helix-turn-helix domain-containing protein [Geminocystis sp.]HIK38668.1 helix-turn-helix domain-containing protein [Geminocystis sp. M7585_C2015_104]MCS7147632.1 helix-turn-helix domain-containing protein [Geminocystis sp.]MCX8078035.1 helix-turn-helix domain-containing protein [Geminocystis sp.]MDW8115325.1 helix-turn-helix domain-containing protein [Geminocystis sp.]